VGSCVGQKGVRVQGVIGELGGMEKVDIIQWTEDQKAFIMSALAPAKDMEVTLDEKKKAATVLVPDDQLSLAIGRDGQNVRLAAKLTGWKIDIRGKGLPAEPQPKADQPMAEKVEEVKPEEKPTKKGTRGKKVKAAAAKGEDKKEETPVAEAKAEEKPAEPADAEAMAGKEVKSERSTKI